MACAVTVSLTSFAIAWLVTKTMTFGGGVTTKAQLVRELADEMRDGRGKKLPTHIVAEDGDGFPGPASQYDQAAAVSQSWTTSEKLRNIPRVGGNSLSRATMQRTFRITARDRSVIRAMDRNSHHLIGKSFTTALKWKPSTQYSQTWIRVSVA